MCVGDQERRRHPAGAVDPLDRHFYGAPVGKVAPAGAPDVHTHNNNRCGTSSPCCRSWPRQPRSAPRRPPSRMRRLARARARLRGQPNRRTDALQGESFASATSRSARRCSMNSGRARPKSVESGSIVAAVGPKPGDFGRTQAECSQFVDNRGPSQPIWPRSGPNSAKFGQNRNGPNLARGRPKLVQNGPESTRVGPNSTKADQQWRGIDEMLPEVRQIWPEFDHMCASGRRNDDYVGALIEQLIAPILGK